MVAALASGAALGCESGGVGDPCTPEDEYVPSFSGYAPTETNVESRSFQCETRVCLVNHFRGRVSCPYGQTLDANGNNIANGGDCHIPGSTDRVTVDVLPQATQRQAADAVYCSCRCDGPDKEARYCECPGGFKCMDLVNTMGQGRAGLNGSYCVKDGTVYDESKLGVDCVPNMDPKSAQYCGDSATNP